MLDGSDVHLVRPARKLRHEGDPAFIAHHGAQPWLFSRDDLAVEAAPGLPQMSRLRGQLALEDRREKWIGVDLAVRVAERHSDGLAAVLEDVDVAHVGQAREL